MEKLVGTEDGFSAAIFERSDQDAIAVIVVDDEDVAVALTGGDREPSGKIHVGLTGGGHDSGKTMMGTIVGDRVGREHVVVGDGIGQLSGQIGSGQGAGGTKVLALLVEVPLDHGWGYGRVTPQGGGS